MSIPVELIDQNPWWRDKAAIENDKYIVTLNNSKVPWVPRIIHKFQWTADAVYSLRGPRQVGKTTLIKSIVKQLIEEGVEPRRILYYTCDLIDNPRELVRIVSSYIDSFKKRRKRLYLFLDEVSSVRDWQKAVKHLSDTGKLSNVIVVLTGSHTLDIQKAYEKLPGRRGAIQDVPDKILLPMKFAEYVETLNDEISKAIRKQNLLRAQERKRCLLTLSEGKIPQELSELSLYGKELERLFKDYLLTGGTPRVINEFLSKVAIPESAYRTFLDVVLGDLAKWNKRESYLRQITRRIIETLGSPVSWNTLKDETDIAHHQTVSEYVDTLRDTFVLLPFYYLDISRGEPDYRKEKRIHFHDPFFLHALRAWVSGSSPYESSLEYMKQGSNVGLLSEGAVADHLVRLAFGLAEQRQLFEYENRVFYWKSHKGREVDFVLRLDNKRYLPIEVKFRRTIRKEDRMGVLDFSKTGLAKGGLILSQNILEAKDRIVTLPVWLFLILA